MSAGVLTITLPRPPLPLSQCFNNFGRRRIESEKYTSWKREVDTHLMAFHAYACGRSPREPRLAGLVKVDIQIRPRRDKRKQDLDNCLKSLGDTLTRNYVIEDDSKIIDLRIRWGQFDMAHETVIDVMEAA